MKFHTLTKQKLGFTLVEVLITLGIIGIVAAMTIPVLITNYQKKTTATRVKKAYSELLQAIKLSENDNESMESWNVGETSSIENTKKYVEKYIMPYYKGLTLCSEGLDKVNHKCGASLSFQGANYLTLNGTEIAFLYRPNDGIYVIIDVNNGAKPNKLGYDAFYFKTNENFELRPFGWYNGITREAILNGYTYNNYGADYTLECRKMKNENDNYRHACTALLVLDNWEFKKDYPW